MSKSIFEIGGFSIIMAILATIITKDLYVGASVLVLAWVAGLTVIAAILPIFGVGLQWILLTWFVWPVLIPMLVLPASIGWIVSVVFWVTVGFGIYVTTIILIALLATMSGR
jgi:hypothetical protein